MSATILLVEDNPHIMNINSEALNNEGYRVLEAETIAEGRALFQKETPLLIVLDILLPDGDGLHLCEEIRGGSDVPILFVTAKGATEEKIEGLQAGGDDYLAKPYDIGELVARVKGLLRRANLVPEIITKDTFAMKVNSNEIVVNDVALRLSQNEFSLLLTFTQNEDKVLTEEFLYDKVWGQLMGSDSSVVQNTISRLRKSIEGTGYVIEKVRNKGYVFLKG